MNVELPEWIADPRTRRFVLAAIVTIVGLTIQASPVDAALSWSLLSPVVGIYWLWAITPRFPQWVVYFVGFANPLALNLSTEDAQTSMVIAVVTAVALASYAGDRVVARNTILAYMFVVTTLAVVEAIAGDFAWPVWLFALAVGWVSGETLWRFGNTVVELEHTKSLVVDQGMLHERRRIARDVHDLVGHSLSVVLLHVTGARHLVHTDPDEAERALEQAEAASRQSLAEIRRTVGLLRDETDVGAPAVPSSDLTDVKGLVDDFVAAGLDVRLNQDGPVEMVDPAVALAGYRIAQEALTNASRHTLGAEVEVRLIVAGEACDVAVTNRGGETIDLGRGSGFGLVSMRERAKSVGGSLIAGPTHDGWTVEASLPVDLGAWR